LTFEEKAPLAARVRIRHNYTKYENQTLGFNSALEWGEYLYGQVKGEAQEAVDKFLDHYRPER
jgi:hypothetical protein